MWPISAPDPLHHVQFSPFEMIPPPSPVPNVIATTSSEPSPAPFMLSPNAATFASLST